METTPALWGLCPETAATEVQEMEIAQAMHWALRRRRMRKEGVTGRDWKA